jgi:hypothetical protein
MNEHHYQRIDKGTKRDHKALARRQPRTQQGTFLPIDPEKRARIVAEAPECIRQGETTTQIACRHNIPARTLRFWLLGDNQVENARGEFLSHELAMRLDEIDNATEPLPLARAREAFRAWSWIAERREARLYGQKQEVTHKAETPILSITIVNNAVDNSALIGESTLIPDKSK